MTGWAGWALYTLTFAAICFSWSWTIVLYINGNRYLAVWNARGQGHDSDYLWVFLVPALNEGVTIADSVARLCDVDATHKIILVINDGSDDDTGDVLASIAGPDLAVLTRTPPNARLGKAAALNNAITYLHDGLLSTDEYRQWTADNTIVAIVDADGRLDRHAPGWVSRHFDNSRVGGVQVNVAIYNQDSWLTRMQAREFQIFGGLFQLGRSHWGTAFMGGNGQFNRLSALRSVSTNEGPWSDYLTEDQELGLRLLERGWKCEHDPATYVSQQGVNSVRRLYRQRTRWMQGNLQVLANVRRLYAHHLHGMRRLDAAFTITMPALQILVGAAVIISLIAAVGFSVPFIPFGQPVAVAVMVAFGFGPIGMGVIVAGRGKGWAGVPQTAALFFSYYLYVWLMWPVVGLGMIRHVRGATTWSKTDREAIGATDVTGPRRSTAATAPPSSTPL